MDAVVLASPMRVKPKVSPGNENHPVFSDELVRELGPLEDHESPLRADASGLVEGEALPSVGSVWHASGECRRCNFFLKGRCRNGIDCLFCHLPHEQRRKMSRQEKRDAKAARAVEDGSSGAEGGADDDSTGTWASQEAAPSQWPLCVVGGGAAVAGIALAGGVSQMRPPPGLRTPPGLALAPASVAPQVALATAPPMANGRRMVSMGTQTCVDALDALACHQCPTCGR